MSEELTCVSRYGNYPSRPVPRLRADWSHATRRLIAGALCVACAGTLFVPDAALAAEWVNVGGTQYNAGTAAGDDAGTWAWDGADDMKLNGYNGGEIKAAGKLNVAYEGKNTVKTEPDYTGAAIKAQDGTSQKAELNITSSNSTDELNVTAEADAIKSTGDLSISGPGTVNTTSTASDGIEAKGDLSITGSGTVNATGGTEGIQSKGKTTIDSSGTVIAKGGEGYGIAAGSDLIIKGGGKVEASSIGEAAIWADDGINISGGSQVEASSRETLAVDTDGSLTVADASLNASGVEYGVYGYKGIALDHATVTVRTSEGGGQAIALFTDGDDIVVKNGSIVDAFAEGEFSAAISTRNHQPNIAGGHIYISDSVVKAIARYVESGSDGPDHYSNDQSGEVIPEHRGMNLGIFAQTYEGIMPATISIVRSKVTAEGDTAAIFALAMSADGKAIGTIEIEGASILTPEGGKVIDYRNKEELSEDVVYEAGQTIGTGDVTIDSPYNEAVAKNAVIAPPEETKPEETKPEETKPEEKPAEQKPAEQQTPVTSSRAKAKPATAKKGLPATGDASLAGFATTAFAGASALLAGLLRRRRG